MSLSGRKSVKVYSSNGVERVFNFESYEVRDK